MCSNPRPYYPYNIPIIKDDSYKTWVDDKNDFDSEKEYKKNIEKIKKESTHGN